MKKKVSKEDYKPVVYAALFGVLIIVLFGVLYSTQVGRVGVAFGALVGDPTIANVMASIDSDPSAVIPVVGANSGPELNQIASRFTGTFGIAEISRKDNEVSVTDANLVSFGTLEGVDSNAINGLLLSGWDCTNDKAIIKVDESGNGLKLLIEGTDLAGLDTAIHTLENYQNYDLNANCVKVLSDNSIVPCLFVTRDLPDTMEQGAASTVILNVDADDYTTVFKSFAIHEDFPAGTAANLQSSGPGYGGQTPTDYVDILYFDLNQNPARDSVITYDFTPSSIDGSFSGYIIDTTGAYDGCLVLGDQSTSISEQPECSENIDCDDNNACTNDTCIAGACSNDPIIGCCITDTDCQAGYSCNTQTNTCEETVNCTDSDGGLDYNIKGITNPIKLSPSGAAKQWEDICLRDYEGYLNGSFVTEAGISEPNGLLEGACGPNVDEPGTMQAYECPDGCLDGACVAIAYNCTDSDGGIVYDVQGSLSGNLAPGSVVGNLNDFCTGDGNELREVYCNGTVGWAVLYDCPESCSNGACVAVGLTLASTFDEIKASPLNYKTVIGGEAPTEDNLASLDINGKFRIINTVIDDVVTDPLNENLVIIGGPCANKAAGIVTGKPWVNGSADPTCADGFTEDQGMLTVYENNGFKQVVIAGYAGIDTRIAGRIVVDYENRPLNVATVNTGGTLNSPTII